MKVVHVVRQFSPSIGGLESTVLNLARTQRKTLGIDAQVVTLDRVFGQSGKLPAAETIAGVPVARLPWRGSSRYPLAFGVLRHLRDADIVHVHAIDFFFDFLALSLPLHRRALIATTHGGFFHTAQFSQAKKLWFNTVTRASLLAYRRVIACSNADRDLFKPVAGRRLVVIENGVEFSKFSEAASDLSTRTIIYFGRFATHKRVALLFPILAALRRLNPEWRLVLAGREGDLTLGDLTAMAENAGVSDAVSCECEPSDAQLRALIGQASFFACLSSYEGFGLAAVEAMSAGLLPVLSDIAPFRRLCGNAQAGLIVDPGEPGAVAQMLEANVLSDKDNEARKFRLSNAASRYDWCDVALEYASVYDAVMDRPPRPAAIELGSRV